MKNNCRITAAVIFGIRRRPTLPDRYQSSTIGTEGLNFCVRYGNRCDPFVITTGNGELDNVPIGIGTVDPLGRPFLPPHGSLDRLRNPDNCTAMIQEFVTCLFVSNWLKIISEIKPSTY